MEENQPIDIANQNMYLTTDAPIMSVILRFGAIGAVVLLLLSTLQFSLVGVELGDEFSMSFVVYLLVMVLNFLTYILFMSLAIKNYKKLNDGFVSLGKAFAVTFLTGLLMAIVSTFFSIFMIYIFGAPGFGMNSFNDLNASLGNKSATFFIIFISSLSTLIFSSMFGAVVALIISVITKKERPLGLFQKNINIKN